MECCISGFGTTSVPPGDGNLPAELPQDGETDSMLAFLCRSVIGSIWLSPPFSLSSLESGQPFRTSQPTIGNKNQ